MPITNSLDIPEGLWTWATNKALGTRQTAADVLIGALESARHANRGGNPAAFSVLDLLKMSAQRNRGVANLSDAARGTSFVVDHLAVHILMLETLGFVQRVTGEGNYRLLEPTGL